MINFPFNNNFIPEEDFTGMPFPMDTLSAPMHKALMANAMNQMKPESERVAPDKNGCKASDIATIEEIQKLLAKEDEPEVILQIFNHYKTKQAICNGISKKFKDSKRTSAVYKKLKPLLKEKNKS